MSITPSPPTHNQPNPTTGGLDALIEQQHADAQDALQAALTARLALKVARSELERAQTTVRQAELTYADATAKLLPFHKLVAA